MKSGVNETTNTNETVLLGDPKRRTRSRTTSIQDDEDHIVSSHPYNGESDDQQEFQEKATKEAWWKTIGVDKVFKMLKFVAMGQHNTKFYRNKSSRYSSAFGGLISLLLYVFIAIMIVYLFLDLFTYSTKSMTESITLI